MTGSAMLAPLTNGELAIPSVPLIGDTLGEQMMAAQAFVTAEDPMTITGMVSQMSELAEAYHN